MKKSITLPPDFNWQVYLDLNPDIKKHPMYSTELGSKNHWIRYGGKEGRKYKYEESGEPLIEKQAITLPDEQQIITLSNNQKTNIILDNENKFEKLLTIIIPNKNGQTPIMTIESLYKQTFNNFDIIVINDFNNNANKARNCGFKSVKTPYVLFSDNDINWDPHALELMYNCLKNNPDISFVYGNWIVNNRPHLAKEWNVDLLHRHNYISTMSMVKTKDHPGFDENILRLQDWDVWLTMASQNKIGKYINKNLFSTPLREGITYNNSLSYKESQNIIKKKTRIKKKKLMMIAK